MAERVQRVLSSRRRLVTTEYIVCEAVNLANARGGHHVGVRILELIERSTAIRVEWIGSLRFEATKIFYRRHSDRRYSFTDCTSFVMMSLPPSLDQSNRSRTPGILARRAVLARFDQSHASADGGAILLKSCDARIWRRIARSVGAVPA